MSSCAPSFCDGVHFLEDGSGHIISPVMRQTLGFSLSHQLSERTLLSGKLEGRVNGRHPRDQGPYFTPLI